MKVTYAPIVSDARGRFGGLVASNWKGISLMRRFQPPTNPNTTAQQEIRRIFINITTSYTLMSTQVRAAWTTFAAGKQFIARNAYIGRNVGTLNGTNSIAALVAAPGDASTIPVVSIDSVTAGVGQLTVVCTAPSTPTGWTLVAVVVGALEELNYGVARTATELDWNEAEDLTSPYSIVVTGLNAQQHNVYAFIRWTAPDGTTRYSAAIQSTGTPT